MNKDRLLLLAEFLETKVPAGRWDYRTIVGNDWQGHQDLSCGTTACAIGWAATIPSIRDAGLVLCTDEYNGFESWETFKLASQVFELSEEEAAYLFEPDRRTRWAEKNEHGPLPETATASQVAAHIRAFVAGDGIPEDY